MLLRTTVQARLQRQWQVNLSLQFTIRANIALRGSLGAHRLRASGIPGGRTRTAASKAASLGKWAKQEQCRGWQCCTGCASVSPKSHRAMQGKKLFLFFLSRRCRCEGPSKPYCNQLISAGKASDFAVDRMKLISSNDDKPVDLLEGCKNNSDMSIVAQENCVPSSNRRSPNMQSQH